MVGSPFQCKVGKFVWYKRSRQVGRVVGRLKNGKWGINFGNVNVTRLVDEKYLTSNDVCFLHSLQDQFALLSEGVAQESIEKARRATLFLQGRIENEWTRFLYDIRENYEATQDSQERRNKCEDLSVPKTIEEIKKYRSQCKKDGLYKKYKPLKSIHDITTKLIQSYTKTVQEKTNTKKEWTKIVKRIEEIKKKLTEYEKVVRQSL